MFAMNFYAAIKKGKSFNNQFHFAFSDIYQQMPKFIWQ